MHFTIICLKYKIPEGKFWPLHIFFNQTDILREEVTRPSFGRYYVFKPTFKIGTNYESDQIFLALFRHLHYIIHVYDPNFYLGFNNPSLPMIREMIEPDDTVGNYYNLVLTEVGKDIYRSRLKISCKPL